MLLIARISRLADFRGNISRIIHRSLPMQFRFTIFAKATATALCCVLLAASDKVSAAGGAIDEAQSVGRNEDSLKAADENYFRDMDGGIDLSEAEIKGRNTWLVWSGGNDRFWETMTASTFGAFDLLKIVAYDPKQKIDRNRRWSYLGLINEPCFDAPTEPDTTRFKMLLDRRRADCAADPFADAAKYPGVAIKARGKNVPAGSYYGEPSGIVGLRLFPNPDFDEAAARNWDADRYFNDPSYYNDNKLVRPYRVGMSCGFCHVGPSPTKPPADPANPQWSNLSSTVGAQYMWVDRVLVYAAQPENFMYQLVHTYRPGAMDTSLVSTDNINNPRTMNALYLLDARLEHARRWGREKLTGGQVNNKQFNDYIPSGPLTEYFKKPDTVFTPRVLKDGSDSVGALGALNRVYLNIGLFSEEWLTHFNPVAGGKPITPIEISVAERNSSYWRATEAQTPAMALFLLKASFPHRLKDAPGGSKYLNAEPAVLDRGKRVFADTCARCHSSKLPPAKGLDPSGCNGSGYLACWNTYWASTKTDAFKQQMRTIVNAPDFLEGNYLSSELRVPVSLLQTNACSPLATNALAGNIWDNFSSQSYKDLPSAGQITIHDPFTGAPRPYDLPDGGRGYTRPASLISAWSTAPFLLNNSVGPYEQDPSVDARMRVFNASIEQMLWPEKRQQDALLGNKVPGTIDRTTVRSYIRIPIGFQPEILRPISGRLSDLLKKLLEADGTLSLGPIPAGMPVNLLANLRPLPESKNPARIAKHTVQLIELLVKLKLDLLALPPAASDEELRKLFSNLREPLMNLNKCPDFVVNRGHYFGNRQTADEPALSDDDKRALIEFVKTF
jgi:hypothetical protein